MAAERPPLEVNAGALALVQKGTAGDWFLTGLQATKNGTPVRDVLAVLSVPGGGEIEFRAATGAAAASADTASTGMSVVVSDPETGRTRTECTLVVRGDVTGSGKLNLTQLVRTADALQGRVDLKQPFRMAADLNRNDRLDLSDLVMQAELLANGGGSSGISASAVAPPESIMESVTNPAAAQKRVRAQFVSEINAARAEAGTQKVAQSSLLNDAAQIMAEYLAEHGLYSACIPLWDLVDTANLSIAASMGAFDPSVHIQDLADTTLDTIADASDPTLDGEYRYTGIGLARTNRSWIIVLVYSDKAPTKWLQPTVRPEDWNEDMLQSVADAQSSSAPRPTLSQAAIQAEPDYSGNVPEAVKTMISAAMGERGKLYEYGGVGPEAYDCSGLVYKALHAAGADVMRASSAAYAANEEWKTIEKAEDLKTGDLLFYGPPDGIFHVAIYIGNGVMVHAAPSIGGVGLSYTAEPYYESRFAWGKRVFE